MTTTPSNTRKIIGGTTHKGCARNPTRRRDSRAAQAVLAGKDSSGAQKLLATRQLAHYYPNALTPEEKIRVENFRSGQDFADFGLSSTDLSRLRADTRDKVKRSVDILNLSRVGSDDRLLALKFAGTLPKSPTQEQAEKYLGELQKLIYPEIAKRVPPEVLLTTPELTEGWKVFKTPQSHGLSPTPRFAMRSPDSKISIAFQPRDDGTIRIEGFVSRP